jgi:hypothetical protein
MNILKRGYYKGRKFELGKIVYAEKDILNTEKSFNAALKTLNVIQTEMELMQYGRIQSLDKSTYGKRKAG